MQTTSAAPTMQPKKTSHRASATGGTLSIIGLALAGIGSLLIHANYHSKTVTTTAEKVDDAVASGTMHILSVLLAVPLLVAGFTLAVLAVVFTLLRLRKVKAGGVLFSIVWVALSIWTVKVVIAAFTLLKAHQ